MIGKTISHYKILEKIGAGGMGVVYKAEDTKLDRLVALKFLPKHFSINEEEKKRFIHEAKAAAALEHPNICNIHEIDETKDGQMFIAMAYYEGETLQDKIASSPLLLAEAVNITIQIAEGLNQAHKKDIIHRDIKSANIIVTEGGDAKILDFGLAKLRGVTKLTKEGSTLGTVAYMSPEQSTGEEADQRSDIWSLGILFYEMITGRLPFKGEYDQAIMYAIMNEDPQPVTGLRTGIPMELERIINKTLAKNPDERYQGAADLLVDLRKLKKDSSPEVGVTRKEKRQKPAKKTSPMFLISACLIMIAIIAVILVIWKPFSKKEFIPGEKIGIALVHFDNRTGNKALDHLKLVIPDLLITSLEQSEYFSVLTWERMGDLLKQMGKKKVEFIDKDLGFEICRREGIKNLVVGSYTRLGNTYATDVKVMNVETKKLIKGASSKGKGEQSILDFQIDELSKQISKASGLSELRIKETIKPIKEVTTTSMEAYNYFIRGRKERELVSIKEALKFLIKAIEFDPTFAMAHYELVLIYQRLGDISARDQAIKRAMEFSKKTTKKERLWIESLYVALNRDIKKRQRILKRISEEYPKDKRAHYWLGGMYSRQHLYDEALSEYNRALELDPHWIRVITSILYLYSHRGNFEEAIELNNRMMSLAPGDPLPVWMKGFVFFAMGRLDDAIEKFKETSEIRSFWGPLDIAYIYAIKENYTESLRWIAKDININITSAPSQVRAGQAIFWKAFYNYWLGRHQQALKDLNRVTDLDLEERVADKPIKALADLLRGWIYYDRGELEKVRQYCKDWYDIYLQIPVIESRLYMKTEITAIYRFLQALIELKEGQINQVKPKLKDMMASLPEAYMGRLKELINNGYNLVMGEVLLVEEKPELAITMCKKFSPTTVVGFYETFWFQIYNLPYIHDTLARAYVKMGDLDKAIAEYQQLTTFDPASKDRRLIHPRYHYRLAKLYQGKGLKDKAIKSFNKFIKLWKDCDPIFQPLIEDARKRIKELAGIK